MARKKNPAEAPTLADAITDPAKAAAAAATITQPRANESKAEFLRRMRQEQGLTLRQFAAAADISLATATMAENHPRLIINEVYWARMAEALKLPPDIFSAWAEDPPEEEEPAADPAPQPLPHEGRGAFIRRVREEMQATEEEVEDAALLWEGAITAAENTPEIMVNGDIWEAIAEALDIDLATLLALPAHGPADPSIPPATPAPAPAPPPAAGQLVMLAPADITPKNYRRTFAGAELQELAESLAAQGQLQPLVVRHGDDGGYVLIAGERRWRAAGIGMEKGLLPADFRLACTVRDDIDENTHILASLVENLQRVDVPPLEEAEAFRLAREKYGTAEIAKAVSKTPRYIQQRLALVEKLGDYAKQALADGHITVTQARMLCTAPTAVQPHTIKQIMAGRLRGIDDIRRHITAGMMPVEAALFDPAEYDSIAKPGETIVELESGERFFPNGGIFQQLQEKAIAELTARLKSEGWAWVERATSWFSPNGFERERSEDRSNAGVVIITHPLGNSKAKPEIHYGLVRRPVPPIARPTGPSPEERQRQAEAQAQQDAEAAAQQEAAKEFARQLGETLAQRPHDMMLLMVLDQARPSRDGLFAWAGAGWPLVLPANRVEGPDAPLARIAHHFGTPHQGLTQPLRAFIDTPAMTAGCMTMLAAAAPEEMTAIFINHFSRAKLVSNGGVHPVWREYARMRGIPLPAHLQTDAQTDIVDAANGADDADDADDEGDDE